MELWVIVVLSGFHHCIFLSSQFLVHLEVLLLPHKVFLKHCQTLCSNYLLMFWWITYLASASHLSKVPNTVLTL